MTAVDSIAQSFEDELDSDDALDLAETAVTSLEDAGMEFDE